MRRLKVDFCLALREISYLKPMSRYYIQWIVIVVIVLSIVPDGKDRFAAFVEPNTLLNFVSWTQLKIDDAHSLFFLMSFIFYEHEWDLVGFLIDSVFADDSSDDNENH